MSARRRSRPIEHPQPLGLAPALLAVFIHALVFAGHGAGSALAADEAAGYRGLICSVLNGAAADDDSPAGATLADHCPWCTLATAVAIPPASARANGPDLARDAVPPIRPGNVVTARRLRDPDPCRGPPA